MPLSESDTRAKLIDPALHARGCDLKAVNPTAEADEDLRKPEELLDLIEAKG